MPDKEIDRLNTEVDALKKIIIEMKEAMKLLTEQDDRARVFVERIESLSAALKLEENNG